MSAVEAPAGATVTIGRVAIGIRTPDPGFRRLVEARYAGFVADDVRTDCEFDVELVPSAHAEADDDVRVRRRDSRWHLTRGDFHAEWDPGAGRGRICQSPNPYALDSVLRIVHTLVLARDGGFLVHAASAVRGGRAYLFAGPSGAGKTTLARLAPDDVDLLSDEISYVRREDGGYFAYGTPFHGDLGRSGRNVRAPLAAVYLLAHGREHRVDPVGPADAARGILANVLFFAEDRELVQAVFASALAFVERVPVRRLTFAPDAGAWSLVA